MRLKFGSALVAAFAPAGGVDLDVTCDPSPARGTVFD